MATNAATCSCTRSGSAPGSSGRSFCRITSIGWVRASHAGVARARSNAASISELRMPNGAQPSPSSTARRSEREVRPPTHIGTSACSRARIDDEAGELVVRARDTRAPVATDAARSARIASSARAPRSSNGACSRSNSSRSDPTPTPRIRRPSDDDVERAVPLRDRERVVISQHQRRACASLIVSVTAARYPKIASGSQ